MTYPASPFTHNTFDEALDDLIEDWTGGEDESEIIAALLAKADAMQAIPETTAPQEKPHGEEEDQG